MRVIIEYGENSLTLSAGETVVGRGVTCNLRFNDPAISRKHARIMVQDDKVFLEDLGTTNGTMLNDERISGTRILAHGDQISIGRRNFRVTIQEGGAPDDEDFDDTTADHGAMIAEMARRQAADEMGALLVIRDFKLGEPAPKVTHHNCPGCRAALALDAVSCPHCGAQLPQVRSLSKTLEIRTDMLERRVQPRRLTNIPCLYTSDNPTFEAHARDLSRDGLFIASDLVDEAGTPCAVTLLPDGQPPHTVVGLVSRLVVKDKGPGGLPRGMGIRFSSQRRK